MEQLVMVAGGIAEAVGWRLVAIGHARVWRLMPVVFAAMGIGALLARRPAAATRVSDAVALGVGLASGSVLYLGTRIFVWIADRWTPFRRHVLEKYQEAAEVPLRESLALSLVVMVPAEELFWRGLFQARLDQTLGAVTAGVWAWFAYIAVNAASASLPIVAGAVVGGALWVGLFAWSGGVLASLASHMLWTGLMLALPPGVGRRGGAG